jgi:hypothetical protein
MSEIDPNRLQGDMVPQGEYRRADQLDELHEGTDLDVRGVLFWMGLLVVLFIGTFIAVAAVMGRFKSEEGEKERLALSNRFAADPPTPGPLLQNDPAAETRAILESAAARLGSYGWNDEAKTSAHIPIDRAMAILAERGLPDVGTVDQFHPRPGSSGLPMIGVPGRPAPAPEAGPEAEAPQPEVKP